jgi:hypothetical protein
MTQQTIKETFDQAIVEKIVSFMKKSKFSRKNRVWNRKRGLFIDVVEIDLSKSSCSEFVRCTINSGIYFDPINEIVFGEKTKPFAREVSCPVRIRAGHLMLEENLGKFYDTWWNMESIMDVHRSVDELRVFIEKKELPFLEKFNSMEEIEQFMIARKDCHATHPLFILQLAVLQILMGKIDEGKEKVLSISECKSAWAKDAREILQRLHNRGLLE